jgi:predicted HTH domain antitoxin
MKTIELQVPDALLLEGGGSLKDLTVRSQILLAAKFFELGKLSSGQAAEMCGMNRVDFLFELGRLGVPVADLDPEELQEEARNV